jgi:hypothetical protein
MSLRFNNCKNPYLFRDTILKLIDSSNLEHKKLAANVQDAAQRGDGSGPNTIPKVPCGILSSTAELGVSFMSWNAQ